MRSSTVILSLLRYLKRDRLTLLCGQKIPQLNSGYNNLFKLSFYAERGCLFSTSEKKQDSTSSLGTSQCLKRRGTIVEWNHIERKGSLTDDESGETFLISNTRSFESVLPSHLRGGLCGAQVTFKISESPAAGDRVLIRQRTNRITSNSYKEKPPIDFIALAARSEVIAGTPNEILVNNDASSQTPVSTGEKPFSQRYAQEIEVDMSTLSPNQLARCDGPLAVLEEGGAAGEVAVPPPKHLKDMRASVIFDRSTNEWLRLRRALGSSEAADAYIEERERRRREEEQNGRGYRREVVASERRGVILTWSPLHRTGVVKEGDVTEELQQRLQNGEEEVYDPKEKDIAFIRSVHCFESALPSSRELRGRIVIFDKVQYSTQPNRFFAERIKVENDNDFQLPKESLEADLPKVPWSVAGFSALKSPSDTDVGGQHPRTSGSDSTLGDSTTPSTPTAIYGVITRWSGGQGIIQSSAGHQYQIASAAEFNQLVDLSSHSLRGAVVSFHKDTNDPSRAISIDILCFSNDRLTDVKPTVDVTSLRNADNSQQDAKKQSSSEGDVIESSRSTLEPKRNMDFPDRSEVVIPSEGDWIFGSLVSWSPAEGHGIIQGDGPDEIRFVLRDVKANVIGFTDSNGDIVLSAGVNNAVVMKMLTVGRRLKFTPYGTTGRLACNVIVLDSEADEEEIAANKLRRPEDIASDQANEDESTLSSEGSEEAIVSPTCTSYWLQRMERAGYDVKEVSDMQQKALVPPDDDDDDKFMDSEDLFKKDHWWTDPRKNKKFPNSQVTAGHLALMGPASMMNMAAKASDPKRLDKMVKKYQARLTEEQKELAWQKAREMAPKYEACIRRAKEKNEEPSFHFF